MAEARLALIGIDAAQSLVEPSAYLAKHHMVVRDIALCIQAPVLQQGSAAIAHPPSP